jgi:hypothetical protein
MKKELQKPQYDDEDMNVNVYGGDSCGSGFCGLEW